MENYPFLNEAIAKILRDRRAQMGMSKRRLSEAAMVERAYITKLERGDCNVSVNALFYLCEALSLDPEECMQLIKAELKKLYNSRKAK